MSSSSQRAPQARGYHQDYIVRIRYNNTLPPPPADPKLLDIPNTAFAQYTDPAFASKLARSGTLNIDVDAELGMPLDLVHVPRVFEGDDAAMRPLDPAVPVDPRDRMLLRGAASLGKPVSATPSGGSNVSFLRRTEYISAEQSRSTFRSATDRMMATAGRAKRASRPEDTDPVRILAAVMKGFDTANPATAEPGAAFATTDKAAQNAERNWKDLRHPNKPTLKPTQTWPLLPHLAGTSDTGGYMVFKFTTAPTDTATRGARDTRLDTALFQPVEAPADADAEREMFDFYLPASPDTAAAVKRKFASDADEDEGGEEFRYSYLRRYETKTHRAYAGANTAHPEELALAIDADDTGAAHFYPIITRYVIRPKRRGRHPIGMIGTQASQGGVDEEEGDAPAEALKLSVRDMDAGEKRRRVEYVARLEGGEGAGKEEEGEGEGEGGKEGTMNDEDLDAEGEDEDAPGDEE
ncbi:RNA polymerase II-associated [Geopyxis carbonaria]|nr:RNA polymerase II-associated [Geopyxis carbonaria]